MLDYMMNEFSISVVFKRYLDTVDLIILSDVIQIEKPSKKVFVQDLFQIVLKKKTELLKKFINHCSNGKFVSLLEKMETDLKYRIYIDRLIYLFRIISFSESRKFEIMMQLIEKHKLSFLSNFVVYSKIDKSLVKNYFLSFDYENEKSLLKLESMIDSIKILIGRCNLKFSHSFEKKQPLIDYQIYDQLMWAKYEYYLLINGESLENVKTWRKNYENRFKCLIM